MAADFVAGIFGGLAGIVVGYPADTVKVRLQSQPFSQGGTPLYRGTWNCFTTILRNESVRRPFLTRACALTFGRGQFYGFYKGMTSPLVGVGLINAILFGVYGKTIRMLQDAQGAPANARPTVSQVLIAGSVAGFVNTAISCPLELGKIQMQNQGIKVPGVAVTAAVHSGPLEVLRHVYAARGLGGVFRGVTPTLLRETPSYGVYFAAYELLCRALTPADGHVDELPAGRLLIAGGLSGIFGWLSTYPTDVIKTKMQSVEGLHYRSTLHCAVDIYRQGGAAAFTRGLGATLIRAFPTNAATLLTYTLCMRLFACALARSLAMASAHARGSDVAAAMGFFAPRTAGPHERLE